MNFESNRSLTRIEGPYFEKSQKLAKRSPNQRKEGRICENKLVLAKRSPNPRKEARIREKRTEFAKRSPNPWKEDRICENKPESAKRTLFWWKEARIREKKLVSAKRRSNLQKEGWKIFKGLNPDYFGNTHLISDGGYRRLILWCDCATKKMIHSSVDERII